MKKALRFWIGIWAAILCLSSASASDFSAGNDEGREGEWNHDIQSGLSVLLQDELLSTSQLGLCVYDLTSDTVLYAYQAGQRMRPASTEKLVTAISALSELGRTYQFTTGLYYTGKICGNVLQGYVYVKGGFDPRFGKEDLTVFADSLKNLGIDSIAGSLCADVSMKDTLQWGWGWCWDDDMPVLTPLLYRGKADFMERWGQLLNDSGIRYASMCRSRCPREAVLLAVRTCPLEDVLLPMMKESNNLYAESVFYQMAAFGGKAYASRKEVVHYIENLISRMGYDPGKYLIADGSGVSLYNYLSPELEVAFLKYAYHSAEIYPSLYASLPIAGVDGTLHRRMKTGAARGNVHAKTGTVEGISSLAGYATASNGHVLAFCMIMQGVGHQRSAQEFQDQVCELLCR
ncbi:MAG: D-alanyl-D-alanine carboxypeptidase/D-alanyl-D-alanine-endopeptidase [Paraprevotella sp.]|nr:D-alanyl-D-alanine carboxypeptidase/D-alanyl-D-alanine-endopeptidase [Paraprevotella sp.]